MGYDDARKKTVDAGRERRFPEWRKSVLLAVQVTDEEARCAKVRVRTEIGRALVNLLQKLAIIVLLIVIALTLIAIIITVK